MRAAALGELAASGARTTAGGFCRWSRRVLTIDNSIVSDGKRILQQSRRAEHRERFACPSHPRFNLPQWHSENPPWHLTRSQRLEDSGAILRALLEVLVSSPSELAVYLPGTARQLHTALTLLEQPSTPRDPRRALATGALLPPALHLFPRRTGDAS
jgi:hypothetical protein